MQVKEVSLSVGKGTKKPQVCFFAYVRDIKILELIEFYHNDIKILKELGFEVKIATRFNEIPYNSDLYFSWWWGTGIQALIKAKLSNKPIIMVGNIRFGNNAPFGFPVASRLKHLFIRISWHYSTQILTTSLYEQNIVKQYRKRNISMLYHGVGTKIYKPRENTIRDNILFTICNLYSENAKRKRVKETIEAFAIVLQQFPYYKLVIGGGSAGFKDDTRKKLVLLTEKLGIKNKVIFTGSIPLDKKLHFYQTAKLFVQPSIYEGFGLAIAEAMACSTPVVVCRTGAVPEVVGNCGVYVTGNPESIADGIIRLLTNEDLRNELSVKSRQRILKKFTYEKRKESIKNIINKLIHREIE